MRVKSQSMAENHAGFPLLCLAERPALISFSCSPWECSQPRLSHLNKYIAVSYYKPIVSSSLPLCLVLLNCLKAERFCCWSFVLQVKYIFISWLGHLVMVNILPWKPLEEKFASVQFSQRRTTGISRNHGQKSLSPLWNVNIFIWLLSLSQVKKILKGLQLICWASKGANSQRLLQVFWAWTELHTCLCVLKDLWEVFR